MSDSRLKKWEIALACAVLLILLLGRFPCCAWWGTVYPEYAPDAAGAQAAAAVGAEGVVLRWRALEWLRACLRALGF